MRTQMTPDFQMTRNMLLPVAALLGLLLPALATVLPTPVAAGDFAHSCRSADGFYEMDDGVLVPSNQTGGQQGGGEIKYRVLQTLILSQSKGHCLSNAPAAKGQKFGFEARSYVMRVAFRHDGRNVKAYLLCELASSGLPAAFSCDREVVTYNYTIEGQQGGSSRAGGGSAPAPEPPSAAPGGQGSTPPPPTGGTRWAMGASTLRLIAEGPARRFVYEAPDPEAAKRGIEPGSVLFEGRRRGAQYAGEAYTYSTACGRRAYKVEGRVADGDRRVVLSGFRPRFNTSCRRVGYVRTEMTLDLSR